MDWNTVLQHIIDYIENHLQRDEEPIDNDEIARIAGCSFNFFQKVFSYMNKISFAEYIRYRKLTLAGYDIKSTDLKVVYISYKYGYDSPTSFTKAFQQFHGISPRDARSKDAELKVYPKMQLHSKQQYAWRLKQKKSFRLIGKKIMVSRKNNAHYSKIPEFWNECQRNGIFSKLISLDTAKNQGIFGLFGAADPLSDEIEYAVMVISDQALPEGFEEIIISEETWAIFDCLGPTPQAIQNGWRYLLEEWVIKYPFYHADCPELEWYSNGNSYDEQYLSQIWIPIIE